MILSPSPPGNPTFSIVLATRDRPALLERAVRSVLRQTWPDFELIIVDDASAEATRLKALAFRDPRIVYHRRDTSGGAAAARNEGIAIARGRYVSFLDDDDEFLPRFLAETLRALAGTGEGTGFAWTEQLRVADTPAGEKVLGRFSWHPTAFEPARRFRVFLKSVCIGAGGGLTVKRRCLDVAGCFDESFATGEDTELLIRLAREFDFIAIPRILVKVHHHAGSRLHPSHRQAGAIYEKILQKHRTALEAHPGLLAYYHYKIGWWHYYAGDRVRGRRFVQRALRTNPRGLKPWLMWPVLEALGPGGMERWKRLVKLAGGFREGG